MSNDHAENMAIIRGLVKRAGALDQLNFNSPGAGALTGGLIGGAALGGIDYLRRRKAKEAIQSALLGAGLGAGAGASAGVLKQISPDGSLAGGYGQMFSNGWGSDDATLRVNDQNVPVKQLIR